uniref:Bestrophin n=1 Tax=Mus spicilegus TaxID=10103 RepID=A0A8C6H935_MUSSI
IYAQVARYCNRSAELIPLSFVLDFYVTLVVNRWWSQYTSIPLPDQLMCVISASVHGVDQSGCFTRVLKRFPTMEHVVDAGAGRSQPRGGWLIAAISAFLP